MFATRLRAGALIAFLVLSATVILACGGGKSGDAAVTDTPGPLASISDATSTPLPPAALPPSDSLPVPATPVPPTPAPPPPATSSAAAANPVANAIQGLLALKSFRATVSIASPGQPAQTGFIEAAPPDRLHLTLGGLEFITIGNDSYTRLGTTWTRQSAASATGGLSLSVTNLARTAGSFLGRDLAPVGTDSAAGTACQVYRSTTSEVCIDAAGVPLRLASKQEGLDVALTLTERNGNVDIEAPILTSP